MLKRRGRFAVSGVISMILTTVLYVFRLFHRDTIHNSTVPLFTIIFACIFGAVCIALNICALRALLRFFKRDLAQSRSKHIFNIFLLNTALTAVMAFVGTPGILILAVYFAVSTILLLLSYI